MVLQSLVPYAHVADIGRSVAFYRLLGFEVLGSFTPDGEPGPIWVWLGAGRGNLMLNRSSEDEPIISSQQAIFFYIYTDDVLAMRNKLVGAGIEAGPIKHPFYLLRGEFRISDPDGFTLMVPNAINLRVLARGQRSAHPFRKQEH